MPKTAVTILFFVCCAAAFGQVHSVNGIIVGNNQRISGASITNTRNNARTISDTRGMFFIKAAKGDTLIIDHITYTTQKFVISDDDNILIVLRSSSRVLKQVDIHDSLPDPLKKFNQNKKDYAEIYFKGDKSHIISFPVEMYPIPMAGIAINIDKIYNALSKEGKDARSLQRDFVRDYHDDVIDKRFTKKLVQRITGYTGKQLDDFMINYRPDYAFIIKASDYDIELYVKSEYLQNQKKPRSDTQTALSANN